MFLNFFLPSLCSPQIENQNEMCQTAKNKFASTFRMKKKFLTKLLKQELMKMKYHAKGR